MSQFLLRFAPSPNGLLHKGHAYSALLNAALAKKYNADLLIRMEDIDTIRCTQELKQQTLQDLKWLQIPYKQPVLWQSSRFHAYKNALNYLAKMGLVYKAYLTRKQITQFIKSQEEQGISWPSDPDGAPLYPGDDAILSKSQLQKLSDEKAPYALRLNMRRARQMLNSPLYWQELTPPKTSVDLPAFEQVDTIKTDPSAWGDMVLARKDTPTSYHLSVVVDDAAQGITHVVRGQDLYHATSIHRLLQHLLHLPAPIYHHHPLIKTSAGEKLSKSAGHKSLKELREQGLTRQELLQSMPSAITNNL
ncbi:tRNA glutamyl-Q(34) synthetase GluQRS [Polycladidibacter stylochi]|uniref:tRNA glutamyl-Q(34) synthetase GluQRS n=1 Tax=Polycladidibacter stylochi TaxID=1807766 RepID=UPI00082F2406|nr:tRNA glutamyl-Q(34) synthetase GluQRS [Pseudovibrio stylochi]